MMHRRRLRNLFCTRFFFPFFSLSFLLRQLMHELASLREDVSRESNNSEETASPRMIDNHLQPEQADDEALSVKFPIVKLRRMNRNFMKRVLRDDAPSSW